MLRVDDAIDVILSNVFPIDGWDEVFLDNALNRVAFEDVVSNIDVPDFDRSAMDGYALVFGDDKKRFRVVESADELEENCCIRINTGFPIPDKADAIAEVEITKRVGNYIELLKPVERKRNFTSKGIELKKGGLLLKKGERISVRKQALLAYSGVFKLKVFRVPIVGIITTGDEVIFAGDEFESGKVYNANYFILKGLVQKWLGSPVYFGHIKDDKALLKKTIRHTLKRCDILLTTGGVSMGSRDFIKSVLSDMDANIFFEKTTIKPGKPAVFAKIEDKPFFGLPGWPAALFTVAYVYLKPMLFKLAGIDKLANEYLNCIIDESMHSKMGKCYFDRVRLTITDGMYHGVSAGSQKTDNFYSVAVADGLVRIDEKEEDKEKGAELPLIVFDD
ncbi:molybdopterin molybdotransferase MoeA [Hippea maritima]|uniref:Molybdopterin molybdenumtransferase n=1 Tax=Hippea maritima (strain ATCC 700847 / DSM 10411 / MH2) TaxID=760142 RepID=F2LY95_HIPMA|nr:molybdopterin molybdotransferase MoeA [Hippea maritima]AEA34418.1 molybdenum cofactor synthesis domain protein [Hippea maritima DSM 10411]